MWKVHLVCKDEDRTVLEFWVVDKGAEYFCCFLDPFTVIAVNHEDQSLSILEVMLPQWSESCLSTNIPTVELKISILNIFDIEANCWDGGDGLIEFQLIQDGSLAGCIKAKEQQSYWSGRAESLIDALEHRDDFSHCDL